MESVPIGVTFSVIAALVIAAFAYLEAQWRYAERWDATELKRAVRRTAATGCVSVDVIVPFYNERPDMLERCCAAVAKQEHAGELHVYLVDDGSTNGTAIEPLLARWHGRADSGIEWTVLRLTDNQGKRRAQDAAFRQGTGSIVVTVDSDTILEPGAISALVGAFDHPEVGAATANVRAANTRENWLTRAIDLKYWHIFERERAAQCAAGGDVGGAVLCCSGPLAAFRREFLSPIWNAYVHQRFLGRTCTYGDDLHLTNLILRTGRHVQYVKGSRASTLVPTTVRQYLRQQLRWNRSFYRELWWTGPILWRHSPYIAFDLAARAILPLLLPAATIVAAFLSIKEGIDPSQAVALGLPLLLGALVLVSYRDARFMLVGLISAALFPVRVYAILTPVMRTWGTRKQVEPGPLAEPLPAATGVPASSSVIAR